MRSKRQAVIFVHGLRGDSHGLLDIANELPQDRYEAITLDLPGYGNNPALDNSTTDSYADWLHKYIEEKKIRNPIIVGHSMGSIIASAYLSKYPDDTSSKAVFLSPIFRSGPKRLKNKITCVLVTGGLKLLVPKLRYKLLKSHFVSFSISHTLTCDRSKQKYIDEQHYKYSENFASAASLMRDMKLSMRKQTVIPDKKKLLFCVGDRDRVTDVKIVRETAKKHQIEYVEIADTGHLINYERPKEIANAIVSFIEEKN